MNEQLIADLKETRRQLEARGRCRGDLLKPDGTVCLDGAIVAAVQGYVTSSQKDYNFLCRDSRAISVTRALYDQVPAELPIFGGRKEIYPPMVGVFSFNDDRQTTDQACFNLIDKALAEAGGMA